MLVRMALCNCAAIRDSVQQCASVRGATAYGTMRLKVYVNTCGSVCGAVLQCGSVRYCAVVRAAVCGSHAACSADASVILGGSVHISVRAVCAVVCAAMRGRKKICGSVLDTGVWRCVEVYGSAAVRQCGSVHAALHRCDAAVCGGSGVR